MKVLDPPQHAKDIAIVGSEGCLRVLDIAGTPCHGYQNGCVCPNCSPKRRKRLAGCQCERPMPDGFGRCFKCTKQLSTNKAA